MSIDNQTEVVGELRVTELVDALCLENIPEFVKSLARVLVPVFSQTITNVYVGPGEPPSTERGFVWFRTDNSGSFLYIAVYSGGQWLQVFPAPNQVTWMGGNGATSDDVPPGYLLIDANNPHFTSGLRNAIMSFYYPGSPPYTYFAVTYEGV